MENNNCYEYNFINKRYNNSDHYLYKLPDDFDMPENEKPKYIALTNKKSCIIF